MSSSWQPHGLQHTRLPCPSPSPEFAQVHVHRVGDAIQPSHPLSSPSPPAFIFPSIRVFLSELAYHIRWPKYWGFSFSLSPPSEYSGRVSFRMDWLDLLAVQGILKSFSAPLFKSISSFALWLLGDCKNLAPHSSMPAQEEGRRARGLCAPLQGSPGQGSRVPGTQAPAPSLHCNVGLGAGGR